MANSSYVNTKYKQRGSGVGFVSQPNTAIWDLVWGVTPIEDLAKYKDLATRIPYIAASIRVKANMAISNGFELEGGEEDVRVWLMEWCNKHNFLQTLRVVAWDMMVYGNAYQELCSDENVPPELWWLKGLDPCHMRVRRDEYGNVFGYIQLLTFPPVPFTAQEIMHFKNEPKSNWYEAIYGTSEIRPLLLNQKYIDSYEQDMATIVYSYPPPACYGRRLVLPRMTIKELNEKLCIINRIVVHPKYRTIGLGAKLIRETLPLAGTAYVEMIAVMAKYNPFAEKAGMQKISPQQSVDSVSGISEVLSELGFDLQLLGSERYVKNKLKLTPDQLSLVKKAFIKNKHPRFKKEFTIGRHQPFGSTSDFNKAVQNADLNKIAKLIKLFGVLLQTKVYLFWSAPFEKKENPITL